MHRSDLNRITPAALVLLTICSCSGEFSFGGNPDSTGADVTIQEDTPNAGDTTQQALPPNVEARLQELLDQRLEYAEAPGVAMIVQVPGLGEWDGVSGSAETTPAVPVSVGDRFRIGSITKTFNAAAILLLEDDGELSTSDSVASWLPDLELDPTITVEMLLNHTSGIFNYTDEYSFVGAAQEHAQPEQIIAWAQESGPVFEPGSDWSYSNTGFFVLGLLIEEVTGQPFHEVLRSRLLEPNGLLDTYTEPQEELDGATVDGHTAGAETTDMLDPSWAWAAGGMVSTTHDLCDWSRALYLGDVLPADQRARIVQRAQYGDDSSIGYGLGTDINRRSGVQVVGHTGSVNGFNAEMYIDLETGVCITILTNDFFGKPYEIAHRVWEYVFSEDFLE